MKLKDHSTYPEFKHWCGQIANILHRLKFITNIIMDNLNDIEPSLVDVHIPNNSDNNYEKHGLIFSKYEKQTHLQYVKSEEESPNIITKYKPTSQAGKAFDNEENIKYKEIIEPIIQSIVVEMNKTWVIPEEEKQEIEPGSIMDKPQNTIRKKSMNQGVENLEKNKKN
eukprot:401477_1